MVPMPTPTPAPVPTKQPTPEKKAEDRGEVNDSIDQQMAVKEALAQRLDTVLSSDMAKSELPDNNEEEDGKHIVIKKEVNMSANGIVTSSPKAAVPKLSSL